MQTDKLRWQGMDSSWHPELSNAPDDQALQLQLLL